MHRERSFSQGCEGFLEAQVTICCNWEEAETLHTLELWDRGKSEKGCWLKWEDTEKQKHQSQPSNNDQAHEGTPVLAAEGSTVPGGAHVILSPHSLKRLYYSLLSLGSVEKGRFFSWWRSARPTQGSWEPSPQLPIESPKDRYMRLSPWDRGNESASGLLGIYCFP